MPRPNKETKPGQGSPMRTRTQAKWMEGGEGKKRMKGRRSSECVSSEVEFNKVCADRRGGAQTHLEAQLWLVFRLIPINTRLFTFCELIVTPSWDLTHVYALRHFENFVQQGCLPISSSLEIIISFFHVIASKNCFQRQQGAVFRENKARAEPLISL